MNILFEPRAWQEYLDWQLEDKKMLKRINQLIEDIKRHGQSEGIGKPEPLKYGLSGFWSRRINDAHRLVYKVQDDNLLIIACKSHYGDK